MRLNLTHYDQVLNLLLENQSRTINGYDFEKGLEWIRKTFLTQVPNHFIFGSFHEGELVSICCLMTQFPGKGWGYIGNTFYKPKFTKERLKVLASEEAYQTAVQLGCTTVISCVLEKRYKSQWHLVTRYSDFLKSFEIEPLLTIPVGTYPHQPWLQFILGYHACPETCVIRKATYKAA
jgi:hypothetical protein